VEWWAWLILVVAVIGAVQALATVRAARRALAPTAEECEMRLTPQARVEIGSTIASGKLILAVKQYRDATGADITTAHEAVQRWAKGIHG
jgi:ribosomal protein L7/L12